jgi:cyclohexyl-isocyanide hydratase
VLPTATFDSIGEGLDVLFVPGGTAGTVAAMLDGPIQTFLARHGPSARFVTSICTGSLVLGKAGLLDGYRATSHWVTLDILPDFGATPAPVIRLRSTTTRSATGVSAGLDLGLVLVGLLRDRSYAERVQLAAEYDPHPPFDTGSPAKAGAAVTGQLKALFGPFVTKARAAARAGR